MNLSTNTERFWCTRQGVWHRWQFLAVNLTGWRDVLPRLVNVPMCLCVREDWHAWQCLGWRKGQRPALNVVVPLNGLAGARPPKWEGAVEEGQHVHTCKLPSWGMTSASAVSIINWPHTSELLQPHNRNSLLMKAHGTSRPSELGRDCWGTQLPGWSKHFSKMQSLTVELWTPYYVSQPNESSFALYVCVFCWFYSFGKLCLRQCLIEAWERRIRTYLIVLI